jgi:Fur family ferric uptake transcriptional regulator
VSPYPTQAAADEDWQDTLRAHGYRLTPQRQLVLEAVQTLEHATPDDVFGYVHDRVSGINISTVYRTLELLEELGLVRHTHLGHGAQTYHSSTEPDHVHLVCRQCKRVFEVGTDEVSALVDSLLEQRGFVTDVGHLTVFGTCSDCASPS